MSIYQKDDGTVTFTRTCQSSMPGVSSLATAEWTMNDTSMLTDRTIHVDSQDIICDNRQLEAAMENQKRALQSLREQHKFLMQKRHASTSMNKNAVTTRDGHETTEDMQLSKQEWKLEKDSLAKRVNELETKMEAIQTVCQRETKRIYSQYEYHFAMVEQRVSEYGKHIQEITNKIQILRANESDQQCSNQVIRTLEAQVASLSAKVMAERTQSEDARMEIHRMIEERDTFEKLNLKMKGIMTELEMNGQRSKQEITELKEQIVKREEESSSVKHANTMLKKEIEQKTNQFLQEVKRQESLMQQEKQRVENALLELKTLHHLNETKEQKRCEDQQRMENIMIDITAKIDKQREEIFEMVSRCKVYEENEKILRSKLAHSEGINDKLRELLNLITAPTARTGGTIPSTSRLSSTGTSIVAYRFSQS